ncbi:hypothetical protein TRAPUB_5060 [Trametes pubescens]|uniref:F-box domain-containing protein n=1 Tax=Trametes pubescens TaxID=154538 RepID=A0A1M2W7D2_TRAPU|nr:hypothetical protein TRAPUB_5060 [Trametes pubescens]
MRRISSFVSFMLKEGHSTYRLKLLRSLHLYWPSIPRPPVSLEATGMALARLFRSLAEDGDLHNLSIHGAEQIVLYPDVPAAITQLTTLEWLNVADARRRTINMLSGLRCPFKVAIISLGSPRNEADGWILSILDKHLLWSLQPFTATLSYLTIATRRFSAPDDPVFPNVTYLNLSTADIRWVRHYVRAFPNLLILSARDCDIPEGRAEYGLRRAGNLSEQETSGTWQSLTSYCGSILTLYLLAIPKHIPKVVFNEVEDGLQSGMLRTVLGGARPRQLQLTLDGAFWLLDPDFLSTFTHYGVDALRHFKLVVKVDALDDVTYIPEALESAIDHVIKPLQVTLVAVTIEVDLSWYCVPRKFEPPLPESDPIEEVLEGWDVDAYAHRIQDKIGAVSPALRSVTVGLWHHRTRGNCQVTLGLTYESFDDSDEEYCSSGSESDGEDLMEV